MIPKRMYTDKEYLDLKFKDIGDQITSLSIKMESISTLLNGKEEEKGLVDKVREQGSTLIWIMWGMFLMFVFMFITHAHAAVDFVSDIFKKRL